MPPSSTHAGRTRADRAFLSAPVTAEEKARAQRNAKAKGLTLAEYIRKRCCGGGPVAS